MAEWLSFFLYLFFIGAACVRPLPRRQRYQAIAIGAAGVSLISAMRLLRGAIPASVLEVIRDWIPGLLMLMVYWQSGRFFRTRNEKLQRLLERFDREKFEPILQRWRTHWNRTWVGAYFELAYLLCYLLVPLGVGVLYVEGLYSAVETYWTLVLSATYPCYVVVSFMQTLPPRLLSEAEEPGDLPGVRRLNLWILRHASIGVNMFPSGHVAATLAAALALLRLVPFAGVVFLLISLSIAVGAVVGRYHYALDILVGAAIPVVVFLVYFALNQS